MTKNGGWAGWHGQTRLTVLAWMIAGASEDTLKLRLGVPPADLGLALAQSPGAPAPFLVRRPAGISASLR